MSRSTSVYVGTYLVATMFRDITATRTIHVCKKNPKHDVCASDLFCRKCGAPVIDQQVPLDPDEQLLSMHDHFNGDTDVISLSAEDADWVEENFAPVHGQVDGQVMGTELLTFEPGNKSIDGDEDAAHEIDPSTFVKPTQEDLDRLAKLFKYTKVEVKFGVIVSISW